jgi:2-C-methyl-D-erythritol 4-phosphate cytidylyltransferase
VLVHDAARPLAPSQLADEVAAAVRTGADAVVPGVPVTDTVKQVDAGGRVVATPDRCTLRAVQTPQGFRRDVLVRAHAAVAAAGPEGRARLTDDAGLCERIGIEVRVVPGAPEAFKITGPADLALAELLLAQPAVPATPAGAADHGPAPAATPSGPVT